MNPLRLFLRRLRPGLRLWPALVLAAAVHGAAAQAPDGMDATLGKMLSALQSGSVADFAAPGDDAFKSGMNPAMFDSMRAQIAPRLSKGYTSTYFGTLHQQGYTVYLWKLEFKDGQDDRLVTMAVKDGKVAGFILR